MSEHEDEETRNIMYVASGAALMVLGAGLVLANPRIRRTVMGTLSPLLSHLQEPLKAEVGKVLPDVERYLKLRSM